MRDTFRWLTGLRSRWRCGVPPKDRGHAAAHWARDITDACGG
jgi:hypothetical protein